MRAAAGGEPGGLTIRAQQTICGLAAAAAVALCGLLATGTHTVQRGETLGGIAQRYGTSVSALAATNAIANPDRIYAGETLRVPGRDEAGEHPSEGHVVRRGETLTRIANRYGASVPALVAANAIANPDRILVGQVLRLPGGGGGGAVADGHVVEVGDTLGGIARRLGLTEQQLADANGIVGGRIYVGQRLLLDPPAATVPASMACPVPGARFMNDWGFPRGGGRFHAGNDLFAPRGTPVAAPAAGTVVQLVGAVGGNQVRLVADDGTEYIGTHLDSFGAGGRVEAGQVIGYVGDSGNAVGGPTHLHFEVRPGGGPAVNPYPLLLAAC